MLGYWLLLIDVVNNYTRCVSSLLAALKALSLLSGSDVDCRPDGGDVVGI
jgi:hypothetical protein